MAVRSINLKSNTPDYRLRVPLDGRTYVLHLRWNQRESVWYLSIADFDSVPIIEGIRIGTNVPLLRQRVRGPRRPPGELFAVAPGSTPLDPWRYEYDAGYAELGTSISLVYVEAVAE